jgi:hypothetical protein
MPPVDPKLGEEAVAMMKTGVQPGVVFERLVTSGVAAEEARAYVDQLVAFKQQAEAMDPTRLRNEAIWMFWQGAPATNVVEHFVRAGVALEHAVPAVERIEADVRKMRPCDRCRRPLVPAEAFFDAMGQQICKTCHALVEIGNSERRVIEGALEMVGVPAFAINATASVPYAYQATPAAPFCGTCRMNSGVHVSAVHPAQRAHLHPGWSYLCGRCGAGLR